MRGLSAVLHNRKREAPREGPTAFCRDDGAGAGAFCPCSGRQTVGEPDAGETTEDEEQHRGHRELPGTPDARDEATHEAPDEAARVCGALHHHRPSRRSVRSAPASLHACLGRTNDRGADPGFFERAGASLKRRQPDGWPCPPKPGVCRYDAKPTPGLEPGTPSLRGAPWGSNSAWLSDFHPS